MTLAVDMRPGASPHIDLWRNGNCNNTTCLRMNAYVSFNLHWHSIGVSPIESMTQSYYSIDLRKAHSDWVQICVPITEHTRARSPSWRYDLIYDIVQVWPDSYQECNALILHRHEHNNQRDSWQSLPCAFILNVRCKAHCYQNHGCEIWVSMRNIPRSFYKEVTLFRQWKEQALAAKQSAIPTSKRRLLFIIVFSWYLYLLLLYI